jgi:conjugative relaxase-like TrwC/TraI family protein
MSAVLGARLVVAFQRNARVVRSSPHCSSMSASLVGSVCWGGWLLMVASVAAIRAGDAGASVAYYVDEVSRDRHDYYAGHDEAPGVWHGAFAEHFGLPGHVAAEDFRAVLEGRDPTTGEPLKARANRRVAAWDVTFSPPKSISALWALAPDDARGQVRDAQTAAVDAAIGSLTAHACVARLGRDGVDRQDGSQLGFLRAEFTHRCSREGDPQLHSHSILVNILEAPDGRRAALDGGMLFQHAKAADGIYQAALRAELTQRLGVGWERRDEQWEVAGIPPGLCREWSKRRSQITAALAARGLDPDTASGRAAQTAALATRHAKVQIGDGRSLHDRFAREAIVAGHDPGYILQAALHAGVQQGPPHGSRVTRLLDAMTGPDGVTKQASSFSRRDAIIDLAGRSAIHGAGADNAAARVEILVNRLLRDDRVVPVLAPAARTTSELLRVRDATGRIIRTVDQPERRYTTVDLLAAETELLGRATRRQNAGVARIPRRIVDQVLAAHPGLDSDQESMVRTLASSGAGVDVVVGKAGTGKSTALGAYRAAMDAAGIRVVGVAPSATAAHQLAMSAGITDTATVDRLLTELRHGRRALPHGVVVVLDEAAMCPTRTRLALQRAVDAVDGKVVDVGDHRQIPSVDVGGGHYALAQRLGATVLGHNHRFRDPVYRDAAELLRDRQPAAAVGVLRAQGAVSDHYTQPVDAWAEMVDDWLTHRDNGHSVLMLATERATVGELNRLARAHLIARGAITRRSRTYRVPDDRRTITLAVGDEVILRRNQRLTQPDGTTVAVRNGMTGRVTATRRRHVTVELDAAHHPPGGPKSVTLPAGYVGAHVDYGYARTVDTAQGATVDHSLFAPSASATAERAYVALSRGRLTNRIYTTRDRAWIDAIGRRRGHALAVDQQPAVDRSPRHVMRPRTLARDHDRQPPLEVGL